MKSTAGQQYPIRSVHDRLGPRDLPAGAAGASGPKTAGVKPLSLRWNFSWIAAGGAVETACQWGLVVVLAHLGDLEMVGMVVLAFAVCAPVNALAQLGLRGAVVTDARREYQFRDYLALRLAMAVLAFLIIVGIVVTAGYTAKTALMVLAVALGELFRSLSDIFHALLQQHERMDRIAISQMIRGPLTLGLLALGVCATDSVVWAVFAFPLVAAGMLFGYDLPAGAEIIKFSPPGRGPSCSKPTPCLAGLKPRWDVRTMLRLGWLTLPLGVVLMLVALHTSLPRYMIYDYLGKHALGVFVSIFYLGVVGVRVVAALGQSAGPRLAKYHAAANTAAYLRLLGKLLAVVAALGAAVVLVVVVAGEPILGLLYDDDFSPHLDLAVHLMVAAAVMYLTIPLGIAVEAMRCFKTHMVIRAVGIVVLWALLPGFIQAHGLRGAAMAMLIGSTCAVLGSASAILWSVRRGSRSLTLAPSANRAAELIG